MLSESHSSAVQQVDVPVHQVSRSRSSLFPVPLPCVHLVPQKTHSTAHSEADCRRSRAAGSGTCCRTGRGVSSETTASDFERLRNACTTRSGAKDLRLAAEADSYELRWGTCPWCCRCRFLTFSSVLKSVRPVQDVHKSLRVLLERSPRSARGAPCAQAHKAMGPL